MDTYGSDAIFCYGKKVWESGTESPREYADPYKPIPDDKPDAFQSCYETSYLSRINIFDGSAKRNHLLYSLDFSYELNCYQSGLPERHLYGDLCKRTLVSVRKVMGSGAFLPGIEMIYYGCGGIHPGALERIIYPEGASITYDYVRNELNRCSRDKKSVHLWQAVPPAFGSVGNMRWLHGNWEQPYMLKSVPGRVVG